MYDTIMFVVVFLLETFADKYGGKYKVTGLMLKYAFIIYACHNHDIGLLLDVLLIFAKLKCILKD